jgi:hypothetical protein
LYTVCDLRNGTLYTDFNCFPYESSVPSASAPRYELSITGKGTYPRGNVFHIQAEMRDRTVEQFP